MDEFRFPVAESGTPTVSTPAPLFPGAAGMDAPSTLDNVDSVQQTWWTEGSLEEWWASGTLPPPEVARLSTLEVEHQPFIDVFHQVQAHNEQMYQKGKGKGRGLRNGSAEDTPVPPSPRQADADGTIDFDGDDRTCAICLEAFASGDRVLRIVCRHVFHIHCWNDMLISSESDVQDRCPSCRGSARILARFRFIASPAHQPSQDIPGVPTISISTPAQSRAPSADSFVSIFPWNPAPGVQPGGYYHASTRLPNGQPSILVDPGAWTNLGGKKVAREIASLALAAGYTPQQWRMETPLTIMGVGDGTQD